MKLVKPHMKIQKASEDYLESMLMMKEQHGYIRSVDVADHLGVTKPSVTYATKRLRENGYIEMDRDGLITLTDRGMGDRSKDARPPPHAHKISHRPRRGRKDR